MDRKDFELIVKEYYGIYQKFDIDVIVEAILEGGQQLSLIKVENATSIVKENQVMADWDAADDQGKLEIEQNLIASDGSIIV